MRPKSPSTWLCLSAAALALAGCSQRSEDSPPSDAAESAASPAPDAATRDSQTSESSPEATAPGLTTTAAPGVAFAYHYAFSLPGKAISQVQQQHAAACERLGPTRCQVTGMSYDQPKPGEVAARLDLMVAPAIAHTFGGDSIALVEKAEGALESANVDGANVGKDIEASQRASSGYQSELQRIESRLKIGGLGVDERAELIRRADELRRQIGGEQRTRADKEALLATTPMTFAYTSQGLFSASGDPFGKAASASLSSFGALSATLLTFAGLALPWALLVALVVLLFRFRAMKRRMNDLSAVAAAPAEPAPPQ